MLRSVGSQRVGHSSATEQQQVTVIYFQARDKPGVGGGGWRKNIVVLTIKHDFLNLTLDIFASLVAQSVKNLPLWGRPRLGPWVGKIP